MRYVQLILLALALAPCIGSLTACATINDNLNLTQALTRTSIAHFIEASPAPEDRAQHVRDIATEVKTIAGSDQTTLADLQSAVSSRIAKYDLSIADRLLVDDLIAAVVKSINAEIGQGALKPDQRVAIGAIMDAIIQAANLYLPAAAPVATATT